MSKGREATVGNNSLCLHRKLSTSSANPNRSIQQIDNRAASSSMNCNHTKLNDQCLEQIRNY